MTSFEFLWNNAEKPSGKAFARKKITKSNKQMTNAPSSEMTKKIKSGRIEKQKNKGDGKKGTPLLKAKDSITSNTTPVKFTKRKHKKDKLLAKSAATEETENTSEKQQVHKPSSAHYSLFSMRTKDIYVNTNIPGRSVVEKVFSAGGKFSDLELHRHLVSNLEKHGFTTLTNVQEKSIPLINSGNNVLIRSQTGSGKTLTYAVPIIDALQNISPRIQRSSGVQAIIVVPTRELAIQTHELFSKLNTFQWIIVGHLCGGENRKTEKVRLRKGVHVLIGTPGRLLDHILHTTAFKINTVRCLVLDEADRLLDMGFKKDIVRLVEELDRAKVDSEYDPMAMLKGIEAKNEDVATEIAVPLKNVNSKNRQTVLLSATLTKGIAELADFTMKDHVYVDALDESSTVNPDHMIIPNSVKQEFIVTYVKHKLFTLSALLLAKKNHKIFLFMATGQMVDFHYELFTRCLLKMPKNRGKLKSGDVVLLDDHDFNESEEEEEVVFDADFFKLHGSMEQSDRKRVFAGFKSAKNGVLICTDVAARGVDVPEADLIIQYTGPQTDEDYLHRVGRTGRAGKKGSAIIFLTHEEQEYITRLQQHKVFLQKIDPEKSLQELCLLMEEPDVEKAATALQRRYETAVSKDKKLHAMACFAYSSWSRFYNTYPERMRSIFNFRNVNLGHYVTSFALKDTPSAVGRVVRGEVKTVKPKKLNTKLSNHKEEQPQKTMQKRKVKSVSLTTSEFSDGLEPRKKKKKMQK